MPFAHRLPNQEKPPPALPTSISPFKIQNPKFKIPPHLLSPIFPPSCLRAFVPSCETISHVDSGEPPAPSALRATSLRSCPKRLQAFAVFPSSISQNLRQQPAELFSGPLDRQARKIPEKKDCHEPPVHTTFRPAANSSAVSSVVEHHLDTVGVAGSKPAPRTISQDSKKPEKPLIFKGLSTISR